MRLPVIFLFSMSALSPLVEALHAQDLRYPGDATLHDVQFMDAKTGWAVGDEGVIWHTKDGGAHWTLQASGTRASLRSVCFLSAHVGWIAGREELPDGKSNGVVLFTRNGGKNWESPFVNTFPGLNKIHFTDARTGFLLGDGVDQLPSGVFKTTDRGNRWRQVDGPRTTTVLDGAFADGDNGALLPLWRKPQVLRQGTIAASGVDPLGLRNMRAVRLVAENAIGVGDGGLVYLSKNGGASWGPANLGLHPDLQKSLDFHALDTFENQVWIVGRPGSIILHSADFGKSWQTQNTNSPVPLKGVCFLNARLGWAVGALGTILATKDGGKTWAAQRRGGTRAALLFTHASASKLPIETLAQLGLAEGYLAAGLNIISPDPKSSPLEQSAAEARFSAAVRRAGGANGQLHWQFPLPDHLTDTSPAKLLSFWKKLHNQRADERLLRQLVLSVRMWRPDVVVVDNPSDRDSPDALASEAVQQACLLASQQKAYPEQISVMGLQPWNVSRVYSLCDSRQEATAVIDANRLLARLGGTAHEYATPAADLLSGRGTELPNMRFFKLIRSKNANAGKFQFMMSGLELKAAQGARREVPAQKKPGQELLTAMKYKGYLRTLTQRPSISLVKSEKLGAEVSRILDKLPQDQGANAAFAIANRYAKLGQWPLARQIFSALVDHYPTHPRAADACRWLVRHDAGSEVRRRYELKQFVRVNVSDVKMPNINIPKLQPVANPKGSTKKTRKRLTPLPRGRIRPPQRLPDQQDVAKPPAIDPKSALTKAVGSSEITYLTNQAELRKRQLNCKELAKRLAMFGPRFAHDPEIQFSLQSIHRQIGEFKLANDWYRMYRDAAKRPNPWWKAAAAEVWLRYRDSLPPKPVLTCRLMASRPFLDGKFDDPCWQGIDPFILKNAVGDTTKQNRTEVRLAYDRDFIYVALRCTHTSPHYVPKTSNRRRDENLQRFDRVRIMLDLDRDYSTYFRFEVDQRGCAAEGCWGDKTWNPSWFIAVHSTKTEWNVEAAIPMRHLTGQPVAINTAWACNIVRILPNRGVQAFSPPANVEPLPEGMGLLMFQDAPRRKDVQPTSAQVPCGR